jgi:sec-independent protein translocase protein TatC
LFTAFLLTLPVLIYQAWMFVAPAVGEVGRATTYILVAMSSSLFLIGVYFGYRLVLPIGLDFLLGYAPDRYNEVITADTYLPFVTRFLLAFGIVFELPAAAYVGAKLGLLLEEISQARPHRQRYPRRGAYPGAGPVQHDPHGGSDGLDV